MQIPTGPGRDACEPLDKWFTGGSAQHFVEQVTVGQGVLGDSVTWRMNWSSGCQKVNEALTVAVSTRAASSGKAGSPGLVREQVPHSRGVLAGSSELGPHRGDRLLQGRSPSATASRNANAANGLATEKVMTKVSDVHGKAPSRVPPTWSISTTPSAYHRNSPSRLPAVGYQLVEHMGRIGPHVAPRYACRWQPEVARRDAPAIAEDRQAAMSRTRTSALSATPMRPPTSRSMAQATRFPVVGLPTHERIGAPASSWVVDSGPVASAPFTSATGLSMRMPEQHRTVPKPPQGLPLRRRLGPRHDALTTRVLEPHAECHLRRPRGGLNECAANAGGDCPDGPRRPLLPFVVQAVAVIVSACSASTGGGTSGSPSATMSSPPAPSVSTAPLPEKYPNAIVVLGHSGTAGYNSDPASPGTDTRGQLLGDGWQSRGPQHLSTSPRREPSGGTDTTPTSEWTAQTLSRRSVARSTRRWPVGPGARPLHDPGGEQRHAVRRHRHGQLRKFRPDLDDRVDAHHEVSSPSQDPSGE